MQMKSIGRIKMFIWNNFKRFIPKKYLVIHYHHKRSGKKPNLRSPEGYNEKLAWLKLYYRDELMRTCTDKAAVREYVEACGLGDLLNECYGVYNNADEINWEALPKQFVLKDTLAGDSMGVLLVYDKDSLNIDETKKTLDGWIKRSSFMTTNSGNWIHEGKKARIVAEKLLIADETGDLPDYKFFCFHGKVYCLYLMRNYTQDRHNGENAFLDRDFQLLPFWRTDYHRITEQPEKPKDYEKMVEIAETLSKPFPHVRVDLYNINGNIVFGELTFFTNSGYIPFEPDSADYEMGRQLILPERNH
jgi:hypothetical protein